MPTSSLREIPVPTELSPLQATLAQAEVVAEMANPAGLRLDEPVVDPLTQYKADLRQELAGYPQDLTTQLAAKAEVADEAIPEVIPYEPPPEPPEPEPDPPVVATLTPATAVSGDAADIVMVVSGSGFTETSVITFNGLDEPTTFISEGEVSTGVKPSLFVVPAVCPVAVRNEDGQTSGALDFTFTEGGAPAPEPEPETVTGTPVVEGA